MLRRSMISLAGGMALAALPARALTPGRTYRIAYFGLYAVNTPTEERILEEFRNRLRQLGLTEGGNLVILWRYAEGKPERYDEFAAEAVRLAVDAVVVSNVLAALAVTKVSGNTPVVAWSLGSDPVRAGLVASLARPGGQVTGIYDLQDDLTPKRIQLLKEAVPTAKRIAIARCPRCGTNAGESQARFDAHDAAARSLGVTLVPLELNAPADFTGASALLRRQRPDGLIVQNDPVTLALRKELSALAVELRLPMMGLINENGSLLGYGTDYSAIFRRAAEFVVRILDGAKPADLPMEQPTKFTMTVNLKTAKAIGLTIPQSVMLQATEVIE